MPQNPSETYFGQLHYRPKLYQAWGRDRQLAAASFASPSWAAQAVRDEAPALSLGRNGARASGSSSRGRAHAPPSDTYTSATALARRGISFSSAKRTQPEPAAKLRWRTCVPEGWDEQLPHRDGRDQHEYHRVAHLRGRHGSDEDAVQHERPHSNHGGDDHVPTTTARRGCWRVIATYAQLLSWKGTHGR